MSNRKEYRLATDAYSKYVTLIASPRQQWLGERTSMVRYTQLSRYADWATRSTVYNSKFV